MPVHLASLSTQLFHERTQRERESVKEYAQELRKLYKKAYGRISMEGPGGEWMGQRLLANQFIVGLRPELNSTIVGSEGNLGQLLVKAKFEEAKGRELSKLCSASRGHPRRVPSSNKGSLRDSTQPDVHHTPGSQQDNLGRPVTSPQSDRRCYNCGLEGHFARDCPYPKTAEKEARGRRNKVVSAMVPQQDIPSLREEMAQFRRKLQEMELAAAVTDATVTTATTKHLEGQISQLGPTVFAPVRVNQVTTDALIDNGSPATITSLEFLMSILAKERGPGETPNQWQTRTMTRFSSPEVTLKNYSGQQLHLVAQLQLTLSQGKHQVTTPVLVQKNAPHPLLLGTDTQPFLGFSLQVETSQTETVDLLAKGDGNGTLSDAEQEKQKSESQENGQCGCGGSDVGGIGDGGLGADEIRGGDTTRWKKTQTNPVPSSSGTSEEKTVSEEEGAGVGGHRMEQKDGTIHLLKATKIPACYQKMVRVSWKDTIPKRLFLFSPEKSDVSLLMEDVLLEVGEGSSATVVIQNHGTEAVCLPEGTLHPSRKFSPQPMNRQIRVT